MKSVWWHRPSSLMALCCILFFVSIVSSLPQLPTKGVTRIAGGTLIDCRVPTISYFPDPDDCRHFYHCSDWSGLQKKSCGSHLYFNAKTGVCDWPSVVRRMRPECPEPHELDEHENPRAHQEVKDHSAIKERPVKFPQSTTIFQAPVEEPRGAAGQPTGPPKPRPSVGVPARFPDQAPVVLFNPSDFILQFQQFQPQLQSQFQPQIDEITAPGFAGSLPGSRFNQFNSNAARRPIQVTPAPPVQVASPQPLATSLSQPQASAQ